MRRQKGRNPFRNQFKLAASGNKIKTNMRDRIRGILFCSFWYLSIIAGFFLLICPILPLVVISPKKYRKWSDLIFGIWEPFPVAMMEVCLGIRVVLTGDKINPFEGSLFVVNHRTRVDWNFLWLGLFHGCQSKAHNMKYVLKAPIMHFPGSGWVMQTCSFIFVHRSWVKDKPLLDRMIDYLNNSDPLYQVLLFPEGTDLSEDNIRRSHKFANEHNLEKYYKVLHPRTTGFAFLANKMKTGGQLKAIYDVTIAYPKTMPITEADLLWGKFPEEVHFHIKRYSSMLVPLQQEDLKTWLENVWREKEMKLQRFYSAGRFPIDPDPDLDREDPLKVDFGNLNVKNGAIAYKHGETFNSRDETIFKGTKISLESSSSDIQESGMDSSTHRTGGENVFTPSESDHLPDSDYRPSHLLYIVLVFWLTLIAFTVYEIFNNFYLQIWILAHSLLFTALSLVSNGFQHIAASVYFYRHGRKLRVLKKRE